MDRKRAEKLFRQQGLIVVGWGNAFTMATVKTPDGETKLIYTDGGKQKLLERLKQISSFTPLVKNL